MIPRIIHYCWFGRNPLPDHAKKYIDTWRKYFPGYEIKEWNEDNFDVNMIPYTSEAYKTKKYAFVSDYARFWILYHYGGIYFDTDVEVIKNMDDIILNGPFMGIENLASMGKYETVNPGVGLGAVKGMDFYKRVLDNYAGYHFIMPDGTLNLRTVVQYVTVELIKCGLKRSNDIQNCAGINIYPKDFFNPKGGDVMNITDNTRTIHQYSSSWVSGRDGVVDITSLGFRFHRMKAELKHWLKKFTLLKRNRLVITNNLLSNCYKNTYSLMVASPFDGGWISDEDFVDVSLMISDLQNGNYEFITKEQSKYQSKIFFDYPILRLKGCGAEVHFEEVDSCDDVKYNIINSMAWIGRKDNLFVFVTTDKQKAAKFKENQSIRKIIVSSDESISDIQVPNIADTKRLSTVTRIVCRKIAYI